MSDLHYLVAKLAEQVANLERVARIHEETINHLREEIEKLKETK